MSGCLNRSLFSSRHRIFYAPKTLIEFWSQQIVFNSPLGNNTPTWQPGTLWTVQLEVSLAWANPSKKVKSSKPSKEAKYPYRFNLYRKIVTHAMAIFASPTHSSTTPHTFKSKGSLTNLWNQSSTLTPVYLHYFLSSLIARQSVCCGLLNDSSRLGKIATESFVFSYRYVECGETIISSA